jgi:hypothetical protein
MILFLARPSWNDKIFISEHFNKGLEPIETLDRLTDLKTRLSFTMIRRETLKHCQWDRYVIGQCSTIQRYCILPKLLGRVM